MNLINAAANMVAGGITGYITNDIAVKMLFRKFGPFGGVIIKTRDDFIENISTLVERDIINHHTIQDELSKNEFKIVFEGIVSDIFKKYLYKNTEEIALIQAPGMKESIDNFVDFYGENKKNYISELLNVLFSNIGITDMLSSKQMESLTLNLLNMVVEILKDTDILDDMITQLYLENQENQVTDFIPHRVFHRFVKNFKVSTKDIHTQLKDKFDKEIDNMIYSLYSKLEISSILNELEESIKNKSLAELLGKDHTDNIANELLDSVACLLKSKEGKKLITRFVEDTLSILKKIDLSILDILSKDISSRLEIFMIEKLPELVERFILWIQSNKDTIDDLIEEAIQDVLESGSGGLKEKVKKDIYHLFLNGKASKKFKLVGMIVEGIQSNTDVTKLSKEVSKEIVKTIKNNSIGQIVKKLEDKGAIKVSEITSLIDRNIDRYLDRMDLSFFDTFFNSRIGDILDIELTRCFEDNIKDMVIQKFKKEFLYTNKLTKAIQEEISTAILKTSEYKIANFITKERLDANLNDIKKNIVHSIQKEKFRITKNTSNRLEEYIEGRRFAGLLDEDMKEKIVEAICYISEQYLREQSNRIKYRKIKCFYDDLNNIDTAKSFTEMISIFINNNLQNMLDGKIQGVVRENLSRFPDKMIQEMVEDFMGKELKPITRFGALLGGGAGFLLSWLQGEVGIEGKNALAASVVAYGIVGYLTNIIALKMIFRPYNEKRILGRKIPFTPGVVANEKPRFAKSMGNFIEDDLLNAGKVDEIFRNKKDDIKAKFMETVSKDDYKLIEDVLVSNMEFIANKALDGSSRFVNKNKIELVDNMMEKLKCFNMNNVDFSSVQTITKEKGKYIILDSHEYVLTKFETLLRSNRSMGTLLPQFVKDGLHKEIDNVLDKRIYKISDFINNDGNVDCVMKDYSSRFDSLIDKNLDDIIDKFQKDKLKNNAKKYLYDKLRSNESKRKIVHLVEDKFLKEVDGNKKLEDLFEGKLMKAIYDNADVITKGIIKKLLRLLKSEKRSLKEIAITATGDITGYGLINMLFDIDGTIEDVIDHLIDYKVPKFINEQERDYMNIIKSYLERIGNSKVSDIGVDLSHEGIANLVDNLVNSDTFIENLALLLDGVIDSVRKVKLRDLLKLISINNILDIAKLFEREIDILRNNMVYQFKNQHDNIQREVSRIINDILDKLILTIEVAAMSEGIERENIEKIVKGTLNAIYYGKAYRNNLDRFIDRGFDEIKYNNLDEIICMEVLKEDSINILEKLVHDKDIKENLRNPLENMLRNVATNINEILAKDTKNYVLNLAVDSIIPSIEDHFLELMNSLNIKEITEKQINAMNPQEIEELFNSFAKRYFRTLEGYGLVGGIFGLVSEGILFLI
ncbi:DUF445 family protein [Clostridiaceae bacterium 35-E11]